jgi:hypothetical protein
MPPLGHWKKGTDRQQQDRLPPPHAHLGEQRIWVRRFLRRRGPNYRTLAMQPPPEAEVPSEAGPFQHQRTRRASIVLEQAEPNGAGAVHTNGDGIPSIRVSPAMLPRALGVLDLLLLAAERAGYSVSSTDGPATLVIGSERVPFSIIEEVRRDTGKPSWSANDCAGRNVHRRPAALDRQGLLSD